MPTKLPRGEAEVKFPTPQPPIPNAGASLEEISDPDWAAHLNTDDFTSAHAAWQRRFAGRENSLEASWELAEIEERWGDSLFFSDEPGAAPHYQASRRALAPPGAQWASQAENDRRMDAHRRVTDKLYAIDPFGRPRPAHGGRPHPNFSAQGPRPSLSERRAVLLESRRTTAIRQSGFARLFHDAGHWRHRELGDQWREAGKALAAEHPPAARRAFAWSLYYFELYTEAWSAHLPASRWDPEGGEDIAEVRAFADSLPDIVSESQLPVWIASLLAGDWPAALAATAGDPPAPDFRPLTTLLAEACRAAGQDPLLPGLA